VKDLAGQRTCMLKTRLLELSTHMSRWSWFFEKGGAEHSSSTSAPAILENQRRSVLVESRRGVEEGGVYIHLFMLHRLGESSQVTKLSFSKQCGRHMSSLFLFLSHSHLGHSIVVVNF
jgi:hypothetical protein